TWISTRSIPRNFPSLSDNKSTTTRIALDMAKIVFSSASGLAIPKERSSITASSLRGKEAANRIDLWGATLYDFYYVLRAPDV
ncbi:hypothetical protein BDR05DRAFT_963117, partial [Suillus weaverae]